MLRKKIGKDAPKPPSNTTTTVYFTIETQPPPKPYLGGVKIETSTVNNISKDKISQLVANKVSNIVLIKDR